MDVWFLEVGVCFVLDFPLSLSRKSECASFATPFKSNLLKTDQLSFVDVRRDNAFRPNNMLRVYAFPAVLLMPTMVPSVLIPLGSYNLWLGDKAADVT